MVPPLPGLAPAASVGVRQSTDSCRRMALGAFCFAYQRALQPCWVLRQYSLSGRLSSAPIGSVSACDGPIAPSSAFEIRMLRGHTTHHCVRFAAATSAPGLPSPLPHLHRDCTAVGRRPSCAAAWSCTRRRTSTWCCSTWRANRAALAPVPPRPFPFHPNVRGLPVYSYAVVRADMCRAD